VQERERARGKRVDKKRTEKRKRERKRERKKKQEEIAETRREEDRIDLNNTRISQNSSQ
jgi:hypothetical protein